MAKALKKITLSVLTMLGAGSASAAIGVSSMIDYRGDNYINIDKDILMRGVKFNLSSLTNIDDALNLSLKEDMLIALGKNYDQIDSNDIDMSFFYGGSVLNPKIEFSSDKFFTILYFTVKFHSLSGSFKDSVITFDYRPNINRWSNSTSVSDGANIWIPNSTDDYSNLGDMLEDFNVYLNTNFIKADFSNQWNKMGLISDSLTNYEKQDSLLFNNEMISFGKNIRINENNSYFSTKVFDTIPDIFKVNLFANFNSSLKIGKSRIYSLSSNEFKEYDKVFKIPTFENERNLKLNDYKENIYEIVRSGVAKLTNFEIVLDNKQIDKFNIKFKKSYKDESPSFTWDTKISEMKNAAYIFVSIDESYSPLINVLPNTGFGILIGN